MTELKDLTPVVQIQALAADSFVAEVSIRRYA